MATFLASSIPLLTIQIDYVLQYNKPENQMIPANVYVIGFIVLTVIQVIQNQ
jgi:hypothetical protein